MKQMKSETAVQPISNFSVSLMMLLNILKQSRYSGSVSPDEMQTAYGHAQNHHWDALNQQDLLSLQLLDSAEVLRAEVDISCLARVASEVDTSHVEGWKNAQRMMLLSFDCWLAMKEVKVLVEDSPVPDASMALAQVLRCVASGNNEGNQNHVALGASFMQVVKLARKITTIFSEVSDRSNLIQSTRATSEGQPSSALQFENIRQQAGAPKRALFSSGNRYALGAPLASPSIAQHPATTEEASFQLSVSRKPSQ